MPTTAAGRAPIRRTAKHSGRHTQSALADAAEADPSGYPNVRVYRPEGGRVAAMNDGGDYPSTARQTLHVVVEAKCGSQRAKMTSGTAVLAPDATVSVTKQTLGYIHGVVIAERFIETINGQTPPQNNTGLQVHGQVPDALLVFAQWKSPLQRRPSPRQPPKPQQPRPSPRQPPKPQQPQPSPRQPPKQHNNHNRRPDNHRSHNNHNRCCNDNHIAGGSDNHYGSPNYDNHDNDDNDRRSDNHRPQQPQPLPQRRQLRLCNPGGR